MLANHALNERYTCRNKDHSIALLVSFAPVLPEDSCVCFWPNVPDFCVCHSGSCNLPLEVTCKCRPAVHRNWVGALHGSPISVMSISDRPRRGSEKARRTSVSLQGLHSGSRPLFTRFGFRYWTTPRSLLLRYESLSMSYQRVNRSFFVLKRAK
jgi:hypothetical protein